MAKQAQQTVEPLAPNGEQTDEYKKTYIVVYLQHLLFSVLDFYSSQQFQSWKWNINDDSSERNKDSTAAFSNCIPGFVSRQRLILIDIKDKEVRFFTCFPGSFIYNFQIETSLMNGETYYGNLQDQQQKVKFVLFLCSSQHKESIFISQTLTCCHN